MAEKCVNIIQRFSQDQLRQLLHKHGHGDLEEVLRNGEVTDGEKFLNLDELKILKWRLPMNTRRRLLSFVDTVKKNPEQFITQSAMQKTTFNRRNSVRRNDGFLEKLEKVILPTNYEHAQPKTSPISNEPIIIRPIPAPNKVNRPRAPSPVEQIGTVSSIENKSPPFSPTEEYLDMDRKIYENDHEHYDSNGYLIPIEQRIQDDEENTYEPPPSEKVISHFTPSSPRIRIPQKPKRAPLALPRDSTDERGYIQGPTSRDSLEPLSLSKKAQSSLSLDAVFSKSHKSTKIAASSFSLNISGDEDVAYEPVYEEQTSPIPPINDPQHAIKRLINIALKEHQSDFAKSLPRPLKGSKSEESQIINNTNSLPRPRYDATRNPNISSRPLPPIPGRENKIRSPPPLERKDSIDELPEDYENFERRKLSIGNIPNPTLVSLSPKLNHRRSRSEDSMGLNYFPTQDAKPAGCKKIDESIKQKLPESYELFKVKSPGKSGKKPLPLPPPLLKLDNDVPDFGSNDEDEEYENVVFNLNDYPFYRNTDRKGAKLLLTDLGNGSFLFRPSKRFFLTLSLKCDNQYFNLGIEKTNLNKIRLNTTGDNMSPEFATLKDFVDYFTMELLTFENNGDVIETFLVKSLPPDKF